MIIRALKTSDWKVLKDNVFLNDVAFVGGTLIWSNKITENLTATLLILQKSWFYEKKDYNIQISILYRKETNC